MLCPMSCLLARETAERYFVRAIDVVIYQRLSRFHFTRQGEIHQFIMLRIQYSSHLRCAWCQAAIAIELVVQLLDEAQQPYGTAGRYQGAVKSSVHLFPFFHLIL